MNDANSPWWPLAWGGVGPLSPACCRLQLRKVVRERGQCVIACGGANDNLDAGGVGSDRAPLQPLTND